MTDEAWYIIKQPEGQCKILPANQLPQAVLEAGAVEADESSQAQSWGPFSSQGEAIARRVGLIRAGKCQPM